MLLVVQLFALLHLPHFTEGKAGWLKFLDDRTNASYLIHAGGCAKGALLEKPIQITCVCVNGVWILSQSTCDQQPFILVGKGDCFRLENPMISSLKFIGRPSTPFSQGLFMGTQHLSSFWKLTPAAASINEKDHLPLKDPVTILGINSNKAVTAKNVACCLPDTDKPSQDEFPVHICLKAPRGKYIVRSKCHQSSKPLADLYPISVGYGRGIQIGNAVNETIEFAATATCSHCAKARRITFETHCCTALPFEDDEEFAIVDSKRYDKQTSRMAVNYLDFVLKNKKTAKLEMAEFTHLKYGAHILRKVFPSSSEASSDLVTTILRFFKQAVTESIDDYPMERTMDEVVHQRILLAMQNCLNSAGSQQWEAHYAGEACSSELVKMVTTDGEINCELPEFQRIDSERYDLIIEAVWKIVQFIHYFCAKQFEEHPTDSAYLLTGLERLFNADILRRWTHPGKSYDVLKFLLPTQDLEKFAMVLDACVGTAKNLSVHKQWIRRPCARKTSLKHKKSSSLWNNTGVCLMSYSHRHPSDRPYVDACST